jgi:hypothetical protein
MIFPKWTNYLGITAVVLVIGGGYLAVQVFSYWMTDEHLIVGYQPVQPIKYSHKQHVNDLGIDCRYCHFDVERSSMAGVPPTEVCMNCHSLILKESPEIIKLTKYFETNTPIPWVRVHKLPDYAYFDHSAHVNKGVGCTVCHGRVDQMVEVRHDQSLTMFWCLTCHRDPAKNLREKSLITKSSWKPEGDPGEYGKQFLEKYHINTRIDCSTCHR